MPFYFAGTNCRGSGANFGLPIEAAELYIRDVNTNEVELVNWFDSDGTNYPLSIGLSAMFDSSHFVPGHSVRMEFWVYPRDWEGVPLPPGESAPVVIKNKLMMFEISDPNFTPDPSVFVNSTMTGQNYTLALHNADGWSATTYENEMIGTNAVMVATHGYPEKHDDDASHWIYHTYNPLNYLSFRTTQVGSPGPWGVLLPPYNPTTNPPLNFVHLLTCSCGTQIDQFATGALYPGRNIYVPTIEDQAIVGYVPLIYIADLQTHADLVWNPLKAGKTVGKMREALQVWLGSHPNFHVIGATGDRQMEIADLAIAGDPFTRIKSVFTGTHSNPISWHRPL